MVCKPNGIAADDPADSPVCVSQLAYGCSRLSLQPDPGLLLLQVFQDVQELASMACACVNAQQANSDWGDVALMLQAAEAALQATHAPKAAKRELNQVWPQSVLPIQAACKSGHHSVASMSTHGPLA